VIFNSIRWRVQAWHGLILVLVLTGFGLTAYQVARDNQLRRVDQELDQHLMALFRPPPPGRPPDEPRGNRRFEGRDFMFRVREVIEQFGADDPSQTNVYYYVLWQRNGSLAARSAGAPGDVTAPDRLWPTEPPSYERESSGPPPSPPPRGPMPPTARMRAGTRELFRLMPHGECVLVGRSMAPEFAAMRRLAFWLVAAGTGVLVLGLAGGWWVATRAIRPIEDISATAVKIASGDLSQRINVADTESELGRLASVLNSTFTRLESAFANQARFTADASHELRTPVAVVLTQAQTTLSRDRTGSEYREALEACQRAAQRMRKVIDPLLELARLDAGEAEMKRERFDLAEVTRESVELVRPLAAARGIEIHYEWQPTECLGDAERVGQVVTNLLINAIDYNQELGQVRISTCTENNAARLTITDTGVGISEEDLPHIFERFYRVDKARSRDQGHTGLGLAICKAILEAHAGTIAASSKLGAGSTFSVELPLA
jgi:heavy metal sensor kinase